MSDALVVGAPGVLAAWAHALVREAAALATNSPEIRTLDRLDDAEFQGIADLGRDRLFLSNFPSASLVEKVAAGAVPTVALLDEPTDSARFIKQQSNWPFVEVVRASTLAHTIDRALHDNPSVLIIHRGMDVASEALIDMILQRLGLALSASALAGVKERHTWMGAAASLEDMLAKNVREWTSLDDLPNFLAADEAALVEQILTPMVRHALEKAPPRIVWPQKLFAFADAPDQPPPLVADLTGGARTLFFGPYLYLPPGRYEVSFIVGFSEDVRGAPFVVKAVQMLGQSTLAEARWTAPGGGLFEGRFELTHRVSNEPIEIVLRNDEGAIEGRVALAQVGFDLLEQDGALQQDGALPAGGIGQQAG